MQPLTDIQVASFHQKGWIGPLDAFSTQEVESIRQEIEKISSFDQQDGLRFRTFWNDYLNIRTTLNHHLGYKPLSALFEDKRIVHYLNSLGEEDLLFWRSNIFHRMPGQEGIGWHQAFEFYGYRLDDTDTELVFPEGEDPLNITVWLALVDIAPDVGSLSFANGSHKKKFENVKVPQGQGAYPEEKYYRVEVGSEDDLFSREFDFNEHEWEIESIPSIKAGQIVIFTERVMHCAPSNRSNQERWAINGRYIRPSVAVHPQRLIDNYRYEYGWDLKKHFCILVSGKDDYKINQVVTRY